MQFYHRHGLHRLASHPDLHRFELALWLHTLARSLVAIFVPILLLQIGHSIAQVMVYYLIYNAFDVPLNFLAGSLVRRIGARLVMILGTLATIGFFGLLGVLPPGHWPLLVLLAALAALYDTFFWVAHIYIFIETTREGVDAGRTVGAVEAIRKLGNVVGPTLGALILIGGGKVALVGASVIIFVLSMVPLFRMRDLHDIPASKKVAFREFFRDPQERRDYLSRALFGIHGDASEILWPLFIFTVFGTLGSVAAVPTIVALTTIIFSYLVGRLTREYRNRLIITGSLLIACVWILRMAVQDPLFYYVTVFLMGFLALLVDIPLDSNMTARGVRIGSLEAAVYRNTASMAPRVVLFGVLALAVGVFNVSFILAAASTLLLFAVNALFWHLKAPLPSAQEAALR